MSVKQAGGPFTNEPKDTGICSLASVIRVHAHRNGVEKAFVAIPKFFLRFEILSIAMSRPFTGVTRSCAIHSRRNRRTIKQKQHQNHVLKGRGLNWKRTRFSKHTRKMRRPLPKICAHPMKPSPRMRGSDCTLLVMPGSFSVILLTLIGGAKTCLELSWKTPENTITTLLLS